MLCYNHYQIQSDGHIRGGGPALSERLIQISCMPCALLLHFSSWPRAAVGVPQGPRAALSRPHPYWWPTSLVHMNQSTSSHVNMQNSPSKAPCSPPAPAPSRFTFLTRGHTVAPQDFVNADISSTQQNKKVISWLILK